jgi:glutathione synthase/RimK-type ligase-like ATP-grasp enzyme
MRICIVGDAEDLASVYVGWLAERHGHEVLPLSEGALGVAWSFGLDEARSPHGHIELGQRIYTFADAAGAFVRLNTRPPLPDGLRLAPPQQHAFLMERRSGIHQFLHALPCVVANRPSGGRSNGSKPYQMRLLARAGFEVPRWIVSNEEEAVRAFAADCPNGVIYKACSGLRARVRRLDDALLDRLRAGTTPVVVQQYIPGRDVRIHTVGARVFPTEVIARGVDYRYETEGARYGPTTVPDGVAELCCRVAAEEGLTLAGFDFRVTKDGRWYCLEVNPVPSFLPYEMQTGQPIAQAILDAFAKA